MNKILKAIYGAGAAAAVAFGSALLPFLDEGGFAAIPDRGWVIAGIAALGALTSVGGIVYAVPNTPSVPVIEPADGRHEA